MTIRTRFSPSPTGMIHLGNARAALFSALYAAHHHGAFILRIEDTDAVRSEEKYVDALQDDLHWLHIHWQEGPGVNGPYGPYWQSQRQAVYDHYYEMLEKEALIYPCFCTDQELNLSRKLQLSRGQAPRYAGTCRQLAKEDIQKRMNAGLKPAWRFIVPKNQAIQFIDVVKGPQVFQSDDLGDFIVRRADGTPPFLFRNAIDDATMQITHVLRGEDHVANTPRQILIMQALKLRPPEYGHLSLIVGDDGSPLAKRHGSFGIHHLREEGYLPLAITNYMARLGHTCDNQALLDVDALAKHFYLERLSRSPAHFDLVQLMHWQKLAVQSLDIPMFWHWVGDKIQSHVPLKMQQLFAEIIKANVVFPRDAAMWAKIFFHDHAAIETDEERAVIREAGEQFFVEAEQAVDEHGIDFGAVLADMKATLNIHGKKLFMPLRVALTGKTHGPELVHIAALLGKEKVKLRLSRAFQMVGE